MPSWDTIIAVIVAGFFLSASPGPSMLYVLSRSVGQSRAAGFASSIGLAMGGVLLAVSSAFGLVALFEALPRAFTILQICGGGYLCYLGFEMIRESGKEELSIQKVSNASFSNIINQGVLVELLNPKTAIFLIAFLPQFVNYDRPDVTTQFLILGMLVPLTAIPSDIVVSIAGGSLAQRLAHKPITGIVLGWFSGLILIGLGVRILIMSLS